MKKEDYLAREKDINATIDGLKADLRLLKQEYVAANKPCEIDALIMVGDEKGIVKGFEVSYGSDVVPVVFKIKKDGSVSQRRIYLYSSRGITYLPKTQINEPQSPSKIH
jgi:hypothetical protein